MTWIAGRSVHVHIISNWTCWYTRLLKFHSNSCTHSHPSSSSSLSSLLDLLDDDTQNNRQSSEGFLDPQREITDSNDPKNSQCQSETCEYSCKHDASSPSSDCEIQRLKCFIDYHQRQALCYQKKLNQSLASLGKINDDDHKASASVNGKAENDSGTTGAYIDLKRRNGSAVYETLSGNKKIKRMASGEQKKVSSREGIE